MLFRFPFDSAVFMVFLVTASTVAIDTTVSTATQAGGIRGTSRSTVQNDSNDRDNNNNNFTFVRRELRPGIMNDGASSLFVGDADSDADEYSYFAQLVIKDERYSYNCGGALITPDVVLTAAHCTDGIGATDIGAYVGAHNYRSTANGVEYRTCAEFIVHPSYVPVRYDPYGPVPGTGVTGGNDFALCKLDAPVEIDARGVHLELNEDDDFTGKIAADDEALLTVMGFDRTSSDRTGWTDVLQTVDLPVYDGNECDSYYGGIIDDTMICAWDQTGEGAECGGNSGGPIVFKDGSRHTLLGVSSFSTSTCGSSPGVFSRVSRVMDWVKQNTEPPTSGPTNSPTNSPTASPSSSPTVSQFPTDSAYPTTSPPTASQYPTLDGFLCNDECDQ